MTVQVEVVNDVLEVELVEQVLEVEVQGVGAQGARGENADALMPVATAPLRALVEWYVGGRLGYIDFDRLWHIKRSNDPSADRAGFVLHENADGHLLAPIARRAPFHVYINGDGKPAFADGGKVGLLIDAVCSHVEMDDGAAKVIFSDGSVRSVVPGQVPAVPTPIVSLIVFDGQSLGMGSGSTQTPLYQQSSRWAGWSTMARRVGQDADIRLGESMNTQVTPTITDAQITGVERLQEVISPSGYGGQTAHAPLKDAVDRRTSRPMLTHHINIGSGGAGSPTLASGEVYDRATNQLRAANRLIRANGGVPVTEAIFEVHGETDILRYSQAEADTGGGYFADLLARHGYNATRFKSIFDQNIDPVLLMMQPGRERGGGQQLTSCHAMADFMRAHPDKGCVAAAAYPFFRDTQTDLVHIDRDGQAIMGAYMARAYCNRILAKNAAWKPLHMASLVQDSSTQITVTLAGEQVGNLVVDTTTIPQAPGWGFAVQVDDAVTGLEASAVAVSGNTIVLTFASAIPSGTLRSLVYAGYGRASGETATIDNLPAGNIRDSETEVCPFTGFVLSNWLICDHLPF